MLPFAILASDLDTHHTRLLKAVLSRCHLPYPAPPDPLTIDTLAAVPHDTTHLLSVGKAAVSLWHEFGLVRVDHNHGEVFTARSGSRAFSVMQLQHPGSLMQPDLFSTTNRMRHNHAVWETMTSDLTWFRYILEGRRAVGAHRPRWCARCLCKRESRQRLATYWLDAADGVGLCDDCWRLRAKVVKRARGQKVKKGSVEAQIAGQQEMYGAGGRGLVMRK